MTEAIIVALITGTVTFLCQFLSSRQATKKKDTERALWENDVKHDLKSIQTKLDIHNGYAEKLGSLRNDMNEVRQDIALIKQELKHLKEDK